MDPEPRDHTVKLDPDFRNVESSNHRNYFRPGKVVKVAWAQPSGPINPSDPWSTPAKFDGGSAHQKVKRFIVVRPFKGHCIALAITTHGGQGTTKPGVDPDNHAAVVAVGDAVRLLPGEHLKWQAVEIIVENERHAMSPASRIGFSRLYTVEYSSKVLSIGRVAPWHIQRLIAYTQETIWKSQDLDTSNDEVLDNNAMPDQAENHVDSASGEDAILLATKDTPSAVPLPTFQVGERVLLSHTKGSAARAKFKPLLIKESRFGTGGYAVGIQAQARGSRRRLQR